MWQRTIPLALALLWATAAMAQGGNRGFHGPGPDPRSRPTEKQHIPRLNVVLCVTAIARAQPERKLAERIDELRQAIGTETDSAKKAEMEALLTTTLQHAERTADWLLTGDVVGTLDGEPQEHLRLDNTIFRVDADQRSKLREIEVGNFVLALDPYYGERYDWQFKCNRGINEIKEPLWWWRFIGVKPNVTLHRPPLPPQQQQQTTPPAPKVKHPILDKSWVVEYQFHQVPANGRILPLTEMVKNVMPAIFTIQTATGRGSGFIINDDGVAITNKHVVDDVWTFDGLLADGRVIPGRVIGVAQDHDIALVDLEGSGYPYLKLAPHEPLVGQTVVVVGSPTSSGQTVSQGIVSQITKIGGSKAIQTDAAINKGNSGGPLLDQRGAVLGVVTWEGIDMDGVGWAIAIDEAGRSLPLVSN